MLNTQFLTWVFAQLLFNFFVCCQVPKGQVVLRIITCFRPKKNVDNYSIIRFWDVDKRESVLGQLAEMWAIFFLQRNEIFFYFLFSFLWRQFLSKVARYSILKHSKPSSCKILFAQSDKCEVKWCPNQKDHLPPSEFFSPRCDMQNFFYPFAILEGRRS